MSTQYSLRACLRHFGSPSYSHQQPQATIKQDRTYKSTFLQRLRHRQMVTIVGHYINTELQYPIFNILLQTKSPYRISRTILHTSFSNVLAQCLM
jgi:hypothetical protein